MSGLGLAAWCLVLDLLTGAALPLTVSALSRVAIRACTLSVGIAPALIGCNAP